LWPAKEYEVNVACRLHVTFIDKDGQEHKFEVSKGDNLLDIAQANDLEMEGTSAIIPLQALGSSNVF